MIYRFILLISIFNLQFITLNIRSNGYPLLRKTLTQKLRFSRWEVGWDAIIMLYRLCCK